MKHFDPTKSYRAHDGEIVTNMHRSFAGWKGIGKDGSVYYWYDNAPGSWPTEVKPTFEVGKRYRTRDGRLTEPLAARDNKPYPLKAKVENDPECDWRCWTPDGAWMTGIGNSVLDLMPGAIDDQPKFEAGKTYRTRCGQHIKNVRPIGTMIRGHRVCDDLDFVWYPDGRTVPGETNFNDLLPGAIEDETAALQAEINERKSTAVDPICVLQGQIETLTAAIIQLQADAIARGDRELNAALEQMDEQPEAPDVTLTDLKQIHNRLNRQAERFEKLTAELTSHRVNTAEAVGTNDERIDNIEKHCEAMQGRIEAMESALGGKANGGFAEGHRKRIEQLEAVTKSADRAIGILDGRLDNLQTLENQLATRLDVVRDILEGQGWDLNPQPKATTEQCEIGLGSIPGCECHFCRQLATKPTATVVDSAAWTGRPTPPTRTIEGGWVNVYRDRSGVAARIGDYVWADKEDADAAGIDRIACIQIPDITEGEGL